MLKCSKCGFENPEGNTFCGQCGQSLTITGPTPPPKQVLVPPVLKSGYQQPPTTAASKKSPAVPILIVFFVLIALCCGGGGGLVAYRQAHSGVFIDGKELSRSQVKKGLEELDAMGNALKITGTKAVTLEATSPLSEKFKGLFVRMQEAESNLESDFKGVNVDKIISDQLGTDGGRTKSARDQIVVDQAVKEYFKSATDALNGLDDTVSHILGPDKPPVHSDYSALMSKLSTAYQNYTVVRKQLIDLAKKSKPYESGGHLMFTSDESLNQFRKLGEKHDSLFEAYKKAITQYQTDVAAETQSALNEIRKATEE